jgi:hypothetical protein
VRFPEPIWTLWSRTKFLAPAGNRTPVVQSRRSSLYRLSYPSIHLHAKFHMPVSKGSSAIFALFLFHSLYREISLVRVGIPTYNAALLEIFDMKEMTQNKLKSGAGAPGSSQIVASSHEKWFRENMTQSERGSRSSHRHSTGRGQDIGSRGSRDPEQGRISYTRSCVISRSMI